jgi:hypothetical protein
MLLNLANDDGGAEPGAEPEGRTQDIADMDLQDLLAAFDDESDTD